MHPSRGPQQLRAQWPVSVMPMHAVIYLMVRQLLARLQGVLMQIFTRPLSDRPTVFVEIIQRIGCEREVPGAHRR